MADQELQYRVRRKGSGSLLTPIVGRIGFWVVTFATMFAVAGIADQIAKRVFRRRL
jgi:hypothetical protein